MKHHVSRADTNALLDGSRHDDELSEVDDFLAAMRTGYGAMPAPAPRPELASILDGRRRLRTVPEPIEPATDRPASWSRWTRPLRPVALAFAGATVLFSGLAVAGALPAPVQRASADLATHVGLDLPRPSEPIPARDTIDPDPRRPRAESDDVPRAGTDEIPSPSGTVPAVPGAPTAPDPLPLPDLPPLPAPTIPIPDGVGLGLGPDGLLGLLPQVPPVAPSP
jgi:hypothetical protein